MAEHQERAGIWGTELRKCPQKQLKQIDLKLAGGTNTELLSKGNIFLEYTGNYNVLQLGNHNFLSFFIFKEFI